MKQFNGRAYDRRDTADVKTIQFERIVWARNKEEASSQFLQLLMAAFDTDRVSKMYYKIQEVI